MKLTYGTGSARKRDAGRMTPAGEDYLMRIYVLSGEGKEPVRIKELSDDLGVSPSSASRMATAMSARGLVNFRRYGYITLTEEGEKLGEYLVWRRDVLIRFLTALRGDLDVEKEAETVEHCLFCDTVRAMEVFLEHWDGDCLAAGGE